MLISKQKEWSHIVDYTVLSRYEESNKVKDLMKRFLNHLVMNDTR